MYVGCGGLFVFLFHGKRLKMPYWPIWPKTSRTRQIRQIGKVILVLATGVVAVDCRVVCKSDLAIARGEMCKE